VHTRTDPGRVISMSIAIANTFSRTMGISFHLLFPSSTIRKRIDGFICPTTSSRRWSALYHSTGGEITHRRGALCGVCATMASPCRVRA